ncbi:hypothetical protein WME97_16970 [Sorangium sp. So ce367]|uniref:hypothetical protein n=1 Tax=Sorangium sp. So ce367 TaxID=3133305 RepID=UPI003F62A115
MAGTGNEGDRRDGGPAVAAELDVPRGLALGPDGRLRIAEQGGNRVRRGTPDGTIATVAGTGAAGYSWDGGPAALATSTSPFSIAVGLDGSVYIADRGNHSVRGVAPDGIIDTVAGTGAWGFGGDGGPAEPSRPVRVGRVLCGVPTLGPLGVTSARVAEGARRTTKSSPSFSPFFGPSATLPRTPNPAIRLDVLSERVSR